MSYIELFASQTNVFSGVQKPLKEAKYVVFGVPFDTTSLTATVQGLLHPRFGRRL